MSAVPGVAAGDAGDALADLRGVETLYGVTQYEQAGEFPVERGYIWTTCASVENGNPLFWDDEAAARLTGGPIAPPTMLSVWFRPHYWAPERTGTVQPLQVHFDLKERFDLPEAVMTDNTIVFHDPVRPGDLLRTAQVLRSVSPEKATKLGTGRFWVIDVEYRNQHGALVGVERYTGFGYRRAGDGGATPAAPVSSAPGAPDGAAGHGPGHAPDADEGSAAGPVGSSAATTGAALVLSDVHAGQAIAPLRHEVTATTVVLGALASRDWRPMHHDKDFAVHRNGTRDIFLNTPNQAAWFERYLTDWTGPTGRLGRITFRMKGSVFPGDTMQLAGVVRAVSTDETGCGWVDVDITLSVGGDTKTTAEARLAVPTQAGDNPWSRTGERWRP